MKVRRDGKTTKKTGASDGALKETRRYWKLKEKALDHTGWRTCFGGGCGHVRQTKE